VDILNDLYNRGVSRRNFLTGAGALGAAAALAGCANDGTINVNSTAPTTYSDSDILNFALNLEYLEANYFLYSATGSGLATADQGSNPGTVTGGMQVQGLTPQEQDFINEFAYAEQQHVRFLRSALGSSAVSMPDIDIVNSFNTLAVAANIASSFNPYANFGSWLVGAFVFEDVGVTAYAGAAPLISAAGITSGLLTSAAGIQAVEAYHAGAIRTALTAGAIQAAVPNSTLSWPYLTYANLIATLRSKLAGGGAETGLTVPSSASTPTSIAAANPANAVGYSRTTDQVLHIVYGTQLGPGGLPPGVAAGGFFPNGLNGAIKVTQS
jgi:hypothetical protein